MPPIRLRYSVMLTLPLSIYEYINMVKHKWCVARATHLRGTGRNPEVP